MLFENDMEFLVPVGSTNLMAQKLKKLVLDKAKREENGKKMKKYAVYIQKPLAKKKRLCYTKCVVSVILLNKEAARVKKEWYFLNMN